MGLFGRFGRFGRWEEVNGRRARCTCSARRAPEGGLEGGARVLGGGGILDGSNGHGAHDGARSNGHGAHDGAQGGVRGGEGGVRGGRGGAVRNQRRAQDRLLNAFPIKRPAQVGFTLVVAPSWAQPYNLRHAPKPTGPRTCGESERRAEHLHAHVRNVTRARADRPSYLEPLPSPPCRRAAPPAAASGPCRPAAHQTEQNASASGNA